MQSTIVCSDCQVPKTLDDFPLGKGGSGKVYRRRYCFDCQRKKYRDARKRRHATNPESKAKDDARDKKWRAENPDKVKLTQLKIRAKKRGLDPDVIVKYYNAHDGKCEICKTSPIKQDLALDHCHRTGKFRGLLCNRCNLVLGQIEDSYFILMQMKEYIARHLDATVDEPMEYDNPIAEERILQEIRKACDSGNQEYLKDMLDFLTKLRHPEFR